MEDGAPRVGVLLSGEGMPLEEAVRFGAAAEEAGFDSVWHVEIQREPFVPPAAIAARTKRIRLGNGLAIWARSPVVAALTAADLDELSGGRFLFGIGGPPAWNERYHGIRYERPVERMREYVEVIRGVWTAHGGASFSYEGERFRVDGFRRSVRQERERIPIFLGAVRPRMIRLAGTAADGVLFNVLTTPRYLREYALEPLAAGVRRAGRQPSDLEIASVVTMAVDRDGAQAREWARHHVAYYTVIPYMDAVLNLHGFQREAAAVREAAARGDAEGMMRAMSDEMVEAHAIAGTPDECRRKLSDFGALDLAVLFPPSFQLTDEEIVANHRSVLETFAR